MLLADEEPPPESRVLKGLAFFGATSEEVEYTTTGYLEDSEWQNCPRGRTLPFH